MVLIFFSSKIRDTNPGSRFVVGDELKGQTNTLRNEVQDTYNRNDANSMIQR